MSMRAAELIFPGDRVHLRDGKVYPDISDEERAIRARIEADRQKYEARLGQQGEDAPEAATPSESQTSAPAESAPDVPPSGSVPG